MPNGLSPARRLGWSGWFVVCARASYVFHDARPENNCSTASKNKSVYPVKLRPLISVYIFWMDSRRRTDSRQKQSVFRHSHTSRRLSTRDYSWRAASCACLRIRLGIPGTVRSSHVDRNRLRSEKIVSRLSGGDSSWLLVGCMITAWRHSGKNTKQNAHNVWQ